MKDSITLKQALLRVAACYILIHIHFKLGNVDILPEWLGYLLVYGALPVISQEQDSVRLLKPLNLLLLVMSLVSWCLTLLGVSLSLPAIQILALVVALYYHFQLLTDLASVAKQHGCPQQRAILRLRTVRTILTTLAYLPLPLLEQPAFQTVFLILFLLVIFWLCATLYTMGKHID